MSYCFCKYSQIKKDCGAKPQSCIFLVLELDGGTVCDDFCGTLHDGG